MLESKVRLVWMLLIGVFGVLGYYALNDYWRNRENRLLGEEVLNPLRTPYFTDKGFWVGDVAELYRLGKISRELAEADTAPLHPLVPTPIPIHGYYVRAMESGPSFENDQPPVPFNGQKWCPDRFAILIYPAVPGPGKRIWMQSYGALRFREGDSTPEFRYPTDQELRKHWGIVD